MRKFTRIALVSAAAFATIVPVAGPASADPITLCYVEVIVDTPPSVSAGPGGAKVEIGDYRTEQNCVVINKDVGTSL